MLSLCTQWVTLCAYGHDIALEAHWAPDSTLQGRLAYSDASPASGNYVRIIALDDPSLSAMALQTDEEGQFRVPLQVGRRYAISADGDEGHRITVEIGGPPTAPGSPAGEVGGPPLYLVLGALLLLSVPLARRFTPRESAPPV